MSIKHSELLQSHTPLNNSYHIISVPLPNVPLIDLPYFYASNPWSLNRDYKLSKYFASKSYLIDALNVSLQNPRTAITYRHVPCTLDRNSYDQQINFKRMNQLIFNAHFKLSQNNQDCTKQNIHSYHQSKKPKLIPIKKHSNMSPKRSLSKKHPSTVIYSSLSSPSVPEAVTSVKSQIHSSLNITSHTRFGKSMLVLYFQKHRFISPIQNNKQDQFLRLLTTSIIRRINP
ncbi:hypothetical protein I4U23_028767 [Adineta vaga]|nr:hypothetical protein I4U23_028767 [Adineta vaga]